MIVFQLKYCLGNVFQSFNPIFIAYVSKLIFPGGQVLSQLPELQVLALDCTRTTVSLWQLGTRHLTISGEKAQFNIQCFVE